MPFDLNILNEKIKGIKGAFLNGRFADALAGAVNEGNGKMQQRVFQANEDVNGQGFGQYIGIKKKQSDRSQLRSLFSTTSKTDKKRIKKSAGLSLTSYQRKRAKAGRQVLKKDLEFTGALRRAIETQIENEKFAVLTFNNDEAAKIAKGQENQISNIRNGVTATTKGAGTKIFRLNKTEKEEVIEQGTELIKQILKRKP